jgi:hypothetical protein
MINWMCIPEGSEGKILNVGRHEDSNNKGMRQTEFSVCIYLSRRMRWAGHVARMGEKRNAYRLLVGKPEGKRPLGRPRRWRVDNIRMDLGEVGWSDVD